MLEIFTWTVSIIGAVGIVGLIVLLFASKVAFDAAMAVLEKIFAWLLATRPGCVLLAVLLAVPLAYWGGTFDETARRDAADARAAAAFQLKLTAAARAAATRDQARAAAAEAARAAAEEKAHALSAQIPTTACLDAAAGTRLRQLWPPAPARPGAGQRRAPGAPGSIEDLLRRK